VERVYTTPDGAVVEEVVTQEYVALTLGADAGVPEYIGATPIPAERGVVLVPTAPVVRRRAIFARADDVPFVYRVTRILSYVLGAVEGLLLIRWLLKFAGANPASPFAALVYGVTAPLTALFDNLFPNPRSGAQVIEVTTLVAMLFYILLFWAIAQLLRLRYRSPLA
jgi:hypothetical protein